jgi:HEAT repeat protein
MDGSRFLVSIALTCLVGAMLLMVQHLRKAGGCRASRRAWRSAFPSVDVLTLATLPAKQRLVVLTVAGLSVILCAALLHEPHHRSKPLSYWVDLACEGYDSSSSWEFRNEVKKIGRPAVPQLVRRLRVGDGWRDLYRSLRAYLPPRWQPCLPDVLSASAVEEQRYGAARTLAMFGPDAKPAVTALVRLLPRTKNPVRGVIIQALAAIGPDAKESLPGLHLLLTNQDVWLRVQVAEALWRIDWETNMVLEICTNAMVSGDSVNAALLLSQLRIAAAPAVSYALLVLQDTNHQVGTRANAATVLGAARVSTPEIRNALLQGTQLGEDANLRCNCAMALWRLDSQYARLATQLSLETLIALKQRFPGNEQDFVNWLKARDLDCRESVPTLRQLLASESSQMQEEAARALQKINAPSISERGR